MKKTTYGGGATFPHVVEMAESAINKNRHPVLGHMLPVKPEKLPTVKVWGDKEIGGK